MTPDQYCAQKAAASGSSLYYSVVFLPADKRRAITAVYAFRREVEDTVDEASDVAVARAKLTWWRTELHAALAGNPQHPVSRALLPVAQAFDLSEAHLMEVIDGMQLDLDYNRYPDFPTLEVYCRRVSGVVGMLCARILGYTDPQTPECARMFGIALQLTDIIRDVGADARRNRIYIPLDELARFGMSADDIVALREDERFERLMMFQIERAQSCYDRALTGLPAADRRSQRALLVMAAIQRTLLEEIVELRGKTMNQQVSLTPLRKLWIAWKTWVTA